MEKSNGDLIGLCEVDLCGVGVGEEGFAQGQELTCFAVAVGVGAVAEGLGQTGVSGIDRRLYYGPKLCG